MTTPALDELRRAALTADARTADAVKAMHDYWRAFDAAWAAAREQEAEGKTREVGK